MWNHLFRYDGKHPILAAAYPTNCDSGTCQEVKLYTGDLKILAKDLAAPDEPVDTAEGASCEEYYQYHPKLWILTSDGAVFQPRWPRDKCDHNRKGTQEYPF